MAVIGTFSPAPDGYSGVIRTLTLNFKVRITASDRTDVEGVPDFRILIGTTEVGAAWRRAKQKSPETYLRVTLDDPAWPQPIWGVLLEGPADGEARLVWRRDKRAES